MDGLTLYILWYNTRCMSQPLMSKCVYMCCRVLPCVHPETMTVHIRKESETSEHAWITDSRRWKFILYMFSIITTCQSHTMWPSCKTHTKRDHIKTQALSCHSSKKPQLSSVEEHHFLFPLVPINLSVHLTKISHVGGFKFLKISELKKVTAKWKLPGMYGKWKFCTSSNGHWRLAPKVSPSPYGIHNNIFIAWNKNSCCSNIRFAAVLKFSMQHKLCSL